MVLNAFESGIFSLSSIEDTERSSYLGLRLKTLIPKNMLQRLRIALAQVKTGNTFENLLNKIRKMIDLCIEQKKLLKKYITI